MKHFASILVFFAFATSPAWGQQVSAAITGRITDSSGGTIPNARITATDVERGSVFTTLSNSQGLYDLPRIPVGTYNVKSEREGFQTAIQSNVLLVLNQ